MALLAYAVMHNHFHMIVRQSTAPLAFMMHRIMHRTALLLRATHKLQGHVFERRYRSALCGSADYIRRAIIYTHLNPCRAQLCADPAEYQWSSHALYVMSEDDRVTNEQAVSVREGLAFFTGDPGSDDAARQYIEYVNFQLAVDRFMSGQTPATRIVAPNHCVGGDEHWFGRYASATLNRQTLDARRPIYDVASRLLEQVDPKCKLDIVRTNSRCRATVAVRRQLIAALLASGYRGHEIARFIGISTSAVSAIAVSLRP